MSKLRKFWWSKWRWQRVISLMSRDGMDCQICGGPLDRRVKDPSHPQYITFDHIVTKSAGGDDRLANLRLAHNRCNQARGCDPVTVEDEQGWRAPV